MPKNVKKNVTKEDVIRKMNSINDKTMRLYVGPNGKENRKDMVSLIKSMLKKDKKNISEKEKKSFKAVSNFFKKLGKQKEGMAKANWQLLLKDHEFSQTASQQVKNLAGAEKEKVTQPRTHKENQQARFSETKEEHIYGKRPVKQEPEQPPAKPQPFSIYAESKGKQGTDIMRIGMNSDIIQKYNQVLISKFRTDEKPDYDPKTAELLQLAANGACGEGSDFYREKMKLEKNLETSESKQKETGKPGNAELYRQALEVFNQAEEMGNSKKEKLLQKASSTGTAQANLSQLQAKEQANPSRVQAAAQDYDNAAAHKDFESIRGNLSSLRRELSSADSFKDVVLSENFGNLQRDLQSTMIGGKIGSLLNEVDQKMDTGDLDALKESVDNAMEAMGNDQSYDSGMSNA